jgi:rare lipoprotein A (peptidoglycan hydrolase)
MKETIEQGRMNEEEAQWALDIKARDERAARKLRHAKWMLYLALALAVSAALIAIFADAAHASTRHHQSGRASWFSGCSGHGYYAAHNSIPVGTIVHVVRYSPRRGVHVRICGRGPASWTGNIIDLSPAAFRQLAPIGQGLVRVSLWWSA